MRYALSITGFSCYFSFARISSALMPSASNFFRTDFTLIELAESCSTKDFEAPYTNRNPQSRFGIQF